MISHDVMLTVLTPEGITSEQVAEMIAAGLSRPPQGWLAGAVTVLEGKK